MTVLRVTLPWTSPPLSGNWRGHTRARAARVAQALSDARWAVRAASLPRLAGANVRLVWRVTDNRRRDCDNLAPTYKVVQDALVAEGVLPDDSWVCVPEARQAIERGDTAAMWADVEPLGLRQMAGRG